MITVFCFREIPYVAEDNNVHNPSGLSIERNVSFFDPTNVYETIEPNFNTIAANCESNPNPLHGHEKDDPEETYNTLNF